MMAICPVCDKLTHAQAAPRDPFGQPRVRIGEHEQQTTVRLYDAAPGGFARREERTVGTRCSGSGRRV